MPLIEYVDLDFSQIDAKNYPPVIPVAWMDKPLTDEQELELRRLNVVYLRRVLQAQQEIRELVSGLLTPEFWAASGLEKESDVDSSENDIDGLYYS